MPNTIVEDSTHDVCHLQNVVTIPPQRRTSPVSPAVTWQSGRSLDIVIPAFNEALRIGPTITAIDRELRGAGFPARVIVVDNGSVDATADVIDSLSTIVPIELISCSTPGKGAAVRAGVLFSTAQTVAYCDADLSTPPSTLRIGMDLTGAGHLAVVGSRTAEGASVAIAQPFVRRLGSRAFNKVATKMVGNMGDTQCGFKMLDGELARDVFGRMRLDGYAFDVELIGRLIQRGVPILEVP